MCTLRHIEVELGEAKLFGFTSKIEDVYWDGYTKHYSNFTPVSEFLVERSEITKSYEEFQETFTICCSIFAVVVLSS